MTQQSREQQAAALEREWAQNPRWKGIKRGYSAADVVRLRGSLPIEHTLAKRGAEKLWNLVNTEPFINALGALGWVVSVIAAAYVVRKAGAPLFVVLCLLLSTIFAMHIPPTGPLGLVFFLIAAVAIEFSRQRLKVRASMTAVG